MIREISVKSVLNRKKKRDHWFLDNYTLNPYEGCSVVLSFSFSTLDPAIAATLEPGAPAPHERLQTMKQCKEAGFLVGMNCIPILPLITDDEAHLEEMVKAAKDHGADYILIGSLTLFGSGAADSKTLYFKFLERKYPGHHSILA